MKTNRATLRRLLVSVCLALLTAPLGRAQVATGPVPFGSFSGGSFDAVNNANLNVHFAIPVISKAGRAALRLQPELRHLCLVSLSGRLDHRRQLGMARGYRGGNRLRLVSYIPT